MCSNRSQYRKKGESACAQTIQREGRQEFAEKDVAPDGAVDSIPLCSTRKEKGITTSPKKLEIAKYKNGENGTPDWTCRTSNLSDTRQLGNGAWRARPSTDARCSATPLWTVVRAVSRSTQFCISALSKPLYRGVRVCLARSCYTLCSLSHGRCGRR